MTPSVSPQFATAAAPPKPARKRQRPAPFSIRLNPDERAYLKHKAGNRPLGSYARAKLLDGFDAVYKRKPVRAPTIDYVQFGRLLGLLGKSELSTRLCLLAIAAEQGKLFLSDEDRATLRQACNDVQEMRALLVDALGLKTGKTP